MRRSSCAATRSYGGSRPRRPDEIHVALDTGQAGTIRRIQAGEADYTSLTSPSSEVDRLRARYGPGSPAADAGGQRYFVATQLQLDQLILNTSRPTFASARLRRAVNYALDRRLLAREDLYTGFPAEPTDQYVPPTMPGFRDARIYPLRPDLAKARRLAGPSSRRVVLYTQGGATHLRYAKIVQANLREIGMDVEIRDVGVSMYPRIARRGEPFDMALNGWVSDYPDPLDFLRQLDGRTIQADDNINQAYFDDPAFNRRLDAAERLPSRRARSRSDGSASTWRARRRPGRRSPTTACTSSSRRGSAARSTTRSTGSISAASASAKRSSHTEGVSRVKQLARVVPELGTLFIRLARDRRVHPLRRLQLIVLGAYLVSPIDLIPDFIPVIGQLDDAAIAAVVLRGVVRSAGPEVVAEHWPGSTRSLNLVLRLAGYR